jgi:hypothetical protein
MIAELHLLQDDHRRGAAPHSSDEVEKVQVAPALLEVERRTNAAADIVDRMADDAAFAREKRATFVRVAQ